MLLRQEKNYKQEEGGQETNVLFTHDFLHMETEMQRAPYIKENRAPAGVARCLACARRVLGSIPSLVRGPAEWGVGGHSVHGPLPQWRFSPAPLLLVPFPAALSKNRWKVFLHSLGEDLKRENIPPK